MPKARVYLHQKVQETAQVLDELRTGDHISDWDYDFIVDQMKRVKAEGQRTCFTDKQAKQINRIYVAACESPF